METDVCKHYNTTDEIVTIQQHLFSKWDVFVAKPPGLPKSQKSWFTLGNYLMFSCIIYMYMFEP